MAKIVCRKAGSDAAALRIAQGMEAAGADVFSITYDGLHSSMGRGHAYRQFLVWAKAPNEKVLEEIDNTISRELEG